MQIFSSYKFGILLLTIYAVLLCIATFFENSFGTEMAKIYFYYSPVLFLLQVLLVVNFITISIKHKISPKKRMGLILTHTAFIIILLGALITHLFGVEGSIHLREGETSNQMQINTNKGESVHQLPFSLSLEKFVLERHPGSSSPSSFKSELLIKVEGQEYPQTISMNNVVDIKGYRLFQSSYDKDEKGTILSVNKDVIGRRITYFGYFILFVGFILSFFGKNTRFQQLRLKLNNLKAKSLSILLLLFISVSVNAQEKDILKVLESQNINKGHSIKFGELLIQSSSGRMKPINTFSSEVLRKLHKSDRVGELNSDQFILSLLTFPEMWKQVPFISVPSKKTSFNFDLSDNYCAFVEMFDSNGNYKLQTELEGAYAKAPTLRTKYDKDLIKLDERVNIFYTLVNNGMLNIFPKEDDNKWYSVNELSKFSEKDYLLISFYMENYTNSVITSIQTNNWIESDNKLDSIKLYQQQKSQLEINPQKIKVEIIYNKLEIFRYCKILYLIFGGMLLVLSFLSLFKNYSWILFSIKILTLLIIFIVFYNLSGIIMRWYIGGYAPWSNSYETMVYVSFISILGGLFFSKHSYITFALSTLFAGVILFVSGLNWMDPQIGTLVPVLKSPWLMIHVAIIVAAYGFFGIGCLLGITNLVLLKIYNLNAKQIFGVRVQELSIINEMTLWIGLSLMTIGTFCGAIWANESWGRYWGWDPKETWALITILVYVIVTHLHLSDKWYSLWLFNLLSILAFTTVLMTYFGVNYYFSGMHSYS